MRHLLSPLDFSVEETDEILNLASDIYRHPSNYCDSCHGKKLATLFYEPSTRTRLSFEAAMLNLGGSVLGFSDSNSSSVTKGETVADTIRVVSSYADICAMRHPKEGAPNLASQFSRIPIINAGDGGHNHPTQTFADILTIKELRGSIGNFTIGFCGDLKFGRTVHSLIQELVRYSNINFVLISPDELKLPNYVKKEVLVANNKPFTEMTSLEEALPDLDILYMTRVQKERFIDEEDYLKLKDSYILDMAKLNNAKSDLLILHPLPRVNEIATDVDSDSRAKYFEQAKYAVYVRMALILKLISLKDDDFTPALPEMVMSSLICENPRCITSIERGIKHVFKLTDAESKTYRCIYCEKSKRIK